MRDEPASPAANALAPASEMELLSENHEGSERFEMIRCHVSDIIGNICHRGVTSRGDGGAAKGAPNSNSNTHSAPDASATTP